MTKDEMVDKLSSAVIKMGTEQVLLYLTSSFPFFSLPLVSSLTGLVVGKIIEIVVQKTELSFYFMHVDSYTGQQATKFEQAAKAHDEAIQKGDPNEISKAEQDLIDAARNLIKFGR